MEIITPNLKKFNSLPQQHRAELKEKFSDKTGRSLATYIGKVANRVPLTPKQTEVFNELVDFYFDHANAQTV